MKTCLIMMFLAMTCHAFHFATRRWDFGRDRENIDWMTTDNGNVFITRNKKMQWFRPIIDKPIVHLDRDFPKTINRVSVRKKALLVSMSPDNSHYVSETMVFVNGGFYSVRWRDNTLYETVIEKNGYVLRSNYFGNITYGDNEHMFTYNTRKYINCTYSAMIVHDKYLWCAMEYVRNQTRVTRVDAFDLFVKRDGVDYIASIPDMSFMIENKGCSQPFQLRVSIEEDHPQKIIYLAIGYMQGGVNVAQCYYPPEKKHTRMMCAHLPNEHLVRSISLDFPYLFFLDEEGISAYRLFARVDVHQYIGKHRIVRDHYHQPTQIVSINKRVFWNGGQKLYSAEIID